MTNTFIIYDTEYWSDKGVMQRGWTGLDDYPRLLIQIGAYKVESSEGLPIVEEYLGYVIPRNSENEVAPITDFFTELTNITKEDVAKQGVEIPHAISDFKDFCGTNNMFSYGNDMLSTFLVSCFVNGINCPFSYRQSKDVRQIFRKCGIAEQDIYANTSGSIAKFLGVDMGAGHHVHDARNDAKSILEGLRHLQKENKLDLNWLL